MADLRLSESKAALAEICGYKVFADSEILILVKDPPPRQQVYVSGSAISPRLQCVLPRLTSCARGDKIYPRPSPPHRGRPSASSAAEQSQRSSTFPMPNAFPR